MTVSTVAFQTIQNTNNVLSGIATIDNGGDETAQIPCGGRSLVRINVPTLTTTKIKFNVVPYPGATKQPVHDLSNTLFEINNGTGAASFVVPYLSGCYSFSIVTTAAQGAAREFQVQCVGTEPSNSAT
jgi:hypothetical protein